MVTRIALLGSTGSIGRQTLEVVRANPDEFVIIALAAGGNLALLRQQIAEFHPALVNSPAIGHAAELSPASGTSASLASLEEMVASPQVDLAVIATAGKVGLGYTIDGRGQGQVLITLTNGS